MPLRRVSVGRADKQRRGAVRAADDSDGRVLAVRHIAGCGISRGYGVVAFLRVDQLHGGQVRLDAVDDDLIMLGIRRVRPHKPTEISRFGNALVQRERVRLSVGIGENSAVARLFEMQARARQRDFVRMERKRKGFDASRLPLPRK